MSLRSIASEKKVVTYRMIYSRDDEASDSLSEWEEAGWRERSLNSGTLLGLTRPYYPSGCNWVIPRGSTCWFGQPPNIYCSLSQYSLKKPLLIQILKFLISIDFPCEKTSQHHDGSSIRISRLAGLMPYTISGNFCCKCKRVCVVYSIRLGFNIMLKYLRNVRYCNG
jgi:hypothetical protein